MKLHEAAVIEVTRGTTVESRHLVDIAVMDAEGRPVAAHGEAARPVFPRSAVKSLQALALVESGAADRFGFEPKHIALACASHNGEPMHVEGATHMLASAGLEPRCLECGAQLPFLKEDEYRLVREGREPGAIHNNCSGKHAGFLAFAVHEGMPTQGYVDFGHPVQRAIAGILEEVTGAPHGEANHGIDGCSIPTYAIPLTKLAAAFARLGAGEGGGPQRSAAMTRIRDACMAHPEMIAGTGQGCTRLMQVMKGRVFAKSGAEGMYVAALPQLGLGIALKARDGAERASETAMVNMIESLLELSQTEAKALKRLANPEITNRRGAVVGEIRFVQSNPSSMA